MDYETNFSIQKILSLLLEYGIQHFLNTNIVRVLRLVDVYAKSGSFSPFDSYYH